METQEIDEMKEETVRMKKSHMIAIFGGIVMVLFFVLAVQAVIANGSSAQSSSGSNTNAGNIPSAQIIDGKQVVSLSMKNGNYYPNIIRLRKDMPVEIKVDTNSVTGCYRSIQIPGFDVRKRVSASDNVISFTPEKEGTFAFSCSMGMGNGKIVVDDGSALITGNAVARDAPVQDIPQGMSCGASGGCGCGMH